MTQYNLLSFIDEITGWVDTGRSAHLRDSQKASESLMHGTLTHRLKQWGKPALHMVEHGLNATNDKLQM